MCQCRRKGKGKCPRPLINSQLRSLGRRLDAGTVVTCSCPLIVSKRVESSEKYVGLTMRTLFCSGTSVQKIFTSINI